MALSPVSSLARRLRSSFICPACLGCLGCRGDDVMASPRQARLLVVRRHHEDAVAVAQSWSSCCICPSTFDVLNSACAAASKSVVTFPGSASSLVAQLIELTLVLV